MRKRKPSPGSFEADVRARIKALDLDGRLADRAAMRVLRGGKDKKLEPRRRRIAPPDNDKLSPFERLADAMFDAWFDGWIKQHGKLMTQEEAAYLGGLLLEAFRTGVATAEALNLLVAQIVREPD